MPAPFSFRCGPDFGHLHAGAGAAGWPLAQRARPHDRFPAPPRPAGAGPVLRRVHPARRLRAGRRPACRAGDRRGAPKAATSGIDLAGIDKAVKPGDDFDEYANGAWKRATGSRPTAPA